MDAIRGSVHRPSRGGPRGHTGPCRAGLRPRGLWPARNLRLLCPAVRPILPACLLWLVAACAAPQAPPPPDPGPTSPLARAALAEWDAWGRIVVEGWPTLRPADTAATPERFERLLEYWSFVPGGGAIARQLARRREAIQAAVPPPALPILDEPEEGEAPEAGPLRTVAATVPGVPGPEDIGLYARPAWSAAFIAAVARRAGVPRGDLPASPTHARYIDAVLARALAEPDTAPFLPYAPEELAPRPGDLICADRAWRPLPHWSARLAETRRPRPMHCDVVVRAGPGMVEAVGGNVEDMVVLRRLPADAEGRVLPAPPGKPAFLLILAARDAPS